ncbi:hypothetical protein BCR32DRAFT_271855 [Anaeromyces robustus]|uniref:Uncharacterized protein n=1 Tax=Anaeromyces robustus TaxID=1754192 RepID=A0A1Y1WPY1_9FUNG|nr:hypothetical protein BCR32DRAFT_271855 [Anaeromyces robustus]|eukprot:ORX75542.1 hypothetical protein BCR32DRAFT_271855 [Anaeromyces robustus]
MSSEPVTLKYKVVKACNTFSEYFIQLLHETSLGLYRIYEHNMRKIPQLIKSRGRLERTINNNNIINERITDMIDNVQKIKNVDATDNILVMINRITSLKEDLESTVEDNKH